MTPTAIQYSLLAYDVVHDVGRWSFGSQFALHKLHVWGYVLEELVIAGTQIVESRIAVTVVYESVFRTFAVACEQNVALLALLRKHLFLHTGKLALLG